MLTKIIDALFWLAVVLGLLIYLTRGCSSPFDRFQDWRQDRKEQREDRREERKQSDDRNWRFGDRFR